ncbi:MAG: PDGLE domain-containing protein [Phormidesmis sp.]
MSNRSSRMQYGAFFLSGLGIALLIAAIVSPFASSNPDGLERVAEDLGFIDRAHPEPAAQKLPSAAVFDGYALRGVPPMVATPVAGIVGALAAFGVAWGAGKLLVNQSGSPSETDSLD